MAVFDFTKAYRAEGWGSGIAWRVTGYLEVADEDTEWSGYKVIVEDRVVAHMIGDDHDFVFDVADLMPIGDDEYCPECGQIGCKASYGAYH